MAVNVTELIRLIREKSPLLGREARQYLGDILETIFEAQTSHFGTSSSAANAGAKEVDLVTPVFEQVGKGMRVMVYFAKGNTAEHVSLAFPHANTYPVKRRSNWPDESLVEFLYDGECFSMVGAHSAPKTSPVVDTEGEANIGTDNGAYAAADHSHILYVDHHTDHITRGRLHLDRLPTTDTPDRVLAVGNGGSSPQFQQVNDQMIGEDAVRTRHILAQNVTTEKINDRAVDGEKLFTSQAADRVLAVRGAGENPAYQQVNEQMIANGAVGTPHIQDGHVVTEKIADRAVDGEKLFTSQTANRILAVESAGTSPKYQQANDQMIGEDAVHTRHILAQNVTTEKLASRAVDGEKLFTSQTANRVLRVGTADTDPEYSQIDLRTDMTDDRMLSKNLPTSETANRVLRVDKAGTDPYYDRVQLPTDVEGRLSLDNLPTTTSGNEVLRIDKSGSSPYWGKLNLVSDMQGILSVESGGTGADNPEQARENLETMWDRSPLTGGRMVKRVLTCSREVYTGWAQLGLRTSDIEGYKPGAMFTDAQLVYSNDICVPTGIRCERETIYLCSKYSQDDVLTYNPPRLLFTMHLPKVD